MNYIIKGVLKKILTQYLYIRDDGIDLESGILKLPAGNINHQRLNEKLKPVNIKITESSYKNLTVHIPILEILSKPIKISIQTLDVTIQRLHGEDLQRKESQSDIELARSPERQGSRLEHPQIIEEKREERQNSSYFRNIINRLLYNMEIFMEKINVRMIDQREEEEFRQAFFTINSMTLRNSLVILEANIIKKTLNLQLLHVRHSFGQVQIKDVNICLDFNNKKISLIAIFGSIQIDFFKIPVIKIAKRIAKQLTRSNPTLQKQQVPENQASSAQFNIFLKINSTKLSTKIIKVELSALQSTMKKSQGLSSLDIKFHSLNVKNNMVSCPSQSLLQICYLPISDQVKIYSQFQDNIIKHTLLKFQSQCEGQSTNIWVKVYHLMITISINQVKLLMDSLMNYEREVSRIGKIIKRVQIQMGSKHTGQAQQRKQEQEKVVRYHLLLYRFMAKVWYQQIELKSYGTITFNTLSRQEELPSQPQLPLHKKKSPKKPQRPNLQPSNSKIRYKIRLLQLSFTISGYNICQLSQIQCLYDLHQLTLDGCSIHIQSSLKLLDSIKDNLERAKRDVAYYTEKVKEIVAIEAEEIVLSEESKASEQPQAETEALDTLIPKVYCKINEIKLKIGQLSHRSILNPSPKKQKDQIAQSCSFISVIQIQLINTLFSLLSPKLKLRTDIISYIYSPYTLQRNAFTNELQITIHHNLNSKELNVAFNNNLLILLDDQYINIFYKLFDKEKIWCRFTNLTHEKVKIVQECDDFQPLLRRSEQEYEEIQNSRYFHLTQVDKYASQQVFWLNQKDFKVVMGTRKSQYIELKKSEEWELNHVNELYESRLELNFEDGRQSGYILRLFFNKLGNLNEIVLDYKAHIVSYSQPYQISLGGHRSKIAIDPNYALNPKTIKCFQGSWFHKLQDCFEGPHHPQFYHNLTLNQLQPLITNEHFTIYGIYSKQDQHFSSQKIFRSYLLQQYSSKSLNFTIMPFLIIKNLLDCDVQIEIVDKKSQEKDVFSMKKGESRQLNCNQHFDYYMKQFIIKLIIKASKGNYQSDSFYFNTFTMVDQATQTSIQLRSTAKQDYTKKIVNFSQSLLLKTKLITLKNSAKIVNRSDFSFCFRVKSDTKDKFVVDELFIERHEAKEWCCRLKKDTVIEVTIINQFENKIQVSYGELRGQKILSFNFCRLQDKFYNLLIKIQSRFCDNIQLLQLQNFIEMINLCNNIPNIRIQERSELKYDEKLHLPLNSTSLNKYNNKLVQIDDMNKIYSEIFLTTKVTDQPFKIYLQQQPVIFSELVKHTTQEIVINRDRFMLTLLKDMNNNRITFYLTDSLYNQKVNYTMFNNKTDKYFLLSDDTEYSHHFIVEKEVESAPPQKIFISKQSFNCLVNTDNHDILLCDKDQKHLQKIDKKVLEKQSIRMQEYQFESITVYDCIDEGKTKHIKRQLSTKSIELRLNIFKKIELTTSIRGLTIRQLENGKVDCLIQDIAVQNQETKDHLLRIPEQTYLLLEGKLLHNDHFILLKNVFVKCKNIIINIKRQMPYSIINLVMNLGERMGIADNQEAEVLEPRKYREKIKKFDGQKKLKKYINEKILLVKNVFIHEMHLSLTIELQNLAFSNVIILPQYEVANKFIRQKNFKNEVVTFYLTNLLAKFPKLSFLMTNFKSPLNTLKLFFNIRDAMKQRLHPHPLISFPHKEIPDNPFVFSIQRWNNITNYLCSSIAEPAHAQQKQRLISFIYQHRRYLILTNHHIIWLGDQQWEQMLLTDLEFVRIAKNRVNSEIVMKFKNGFKIGVVQDQKQCMKMLNQIEQLLL